jgi:hypothetical protein
MASTTHTDPVCRMQVTEDIAKATADTMAEPSISAPSNVPINSTKILKNTCRRLKCRNQKIGHDHVVSCFVSVARRFGGNLAYFYPRFYPDFEAHLSFYGT